MDVGIGMKISRQVMEDGLLKWDAEALMNRHNSDVGRLVSLIFFSMFHHPEQLKRQFSGSQKLNLTSLPRRMVGRKDVQNRMIVSCASTN